MGLVKSWLPGEHEGGRPRGLAGGAAGRGRAGGSMRPGPSVPRRTRASGAVPQREPAPRSTCARPRTARRRRARAHRPRARCTRRHGRALRWRRIRAPGATGTSIGLCLHLADSSPDHTLTASEGKGDTARATSRPADEEARVQERPWWELAPRGLAPVSVRRRESLLWMINFIC